MVSRSLKILVQKCREAKEKDENNSSSGLEDKEGTNREIAFEVAYMRGFRLESRY